MILRRHIKMRKVVLTVGVRFSLQVDEGVRKAILRSGSTQSVQTFSHRAILSEAISEGQDN